MAGEAGFLGEWPRGPDPQQAWWARHGVAGRQEAHGRVHAAFLLPSFAQGPASSSPLCCGPAPLPTPPGCHALLLCTGPRLALPALLLCLQSPLAPAPLLAETPPHASRIPFFPVPAWKSYRVLARGLRGYNAYLGVGPVLGKPLPAYSRLFLPFCCSSLGEGRGTNTTSVRPRAQGSPPLGYCPALA